MGSVRKCLISIRIMQMNTVGIEVGVEKIKNCELEV